MKNITMIGAPSCGKSTIGVMLANKLGMDFIDVDIIIQEQTGKLLKEIIAEQGTEGFIKIEGDIAASIEADNSVIAPGGSICYEDWAMEHLKAISTVVYIRISYEEMEKRIGDVVDRGVAIPDGYTLKNLYDERVKLYEQYADVIIDDTDTDHFDDVVDELQSIFQSGKY